MDSGSRLHSLARRYSRLLDGQIRLYGRSVLPVSPSSRLRVFMFVMSRRYIVRRAFLPAGNVFLRILKSLDAFFHKLNDNRWTKGKVLLADSTALNTITEPVAWRETTKSSLGAFRYLVRLFLVMEAPVATLGLLLIAADGSHEPLTLLLLLLWIVVALMIAVKATTLVAGERAHETLDVLLTTPMRSSEIIKQKFRGVTRLMWVLSVPLADLYSAESFDCPSGRFVFLLWTRTRGLGAVHDLCPAGSRNLSAAGGLACTVCGYARTQSEQGDLRHAGGDRKLVCPACVFLCDVV